MPETNEGPVRPDELRRTKPVMPGVPIPGEAEAEKAVGEELRRGASRRRYRTKCGVCDTEIISSQRDIVLCKDVACWRKGWQKDWRASVPREG